MKVLFVSSGNSAFGISPIIYNQGKSLQKEGVDIEFYTLKGKGLRGYLKSIRPLKKYLQKNKFDIVHAHYSMSAFVAGLASKYPVVTSLMGSDIQIGSWIKVMCRIFSRLYWQWVIVKSQKMKEKVGISKASIIPNGVDFEHFKPVEKEVAFNRTGWNKSKRQILFAANPNREVKNFTLAQNAYNLLADEETELKILDNVSNDQMVYLYAAADVIFLTSKWEGSPNVIKEAMACNRPIVSTNVGDISWLTQGVEGCFVASEATPECLMDNLKKAIEYVNKTTATEGRRRIQELDLDERSIALRIINIYYEVMRKGGYEVG